MAVKLGSILGIAIATYIIGPQSEMHVVDNRSIDDRHIRSGKAGLEIRVMGYAAFKPDCSFSGLPRVLLDEPPRHGVVCLRIENVRAQRVFSDAHHCKGLMYRGVKVVYLPRSDFIGADKIYYTVLFPSGRRRTVRAIFSVSPADRGARNTVPPDIAAPMPEVQQSFGPVPYCSALVS